MNRWAPANPLVFQHPDRLGNMKLEVATGLPARLYVAAVLAATIAAPAKNDPEGQALWAARLLQMADALCKANAEDAARETARDKVLASLSGEGI